MIHITYLYVRYINFSWQLKITIIFSCLTDTSKVQDNVIEQCDKEEMDKDSEIVGSFLLSGDKSKNTRLLKGKKKEITELNAEEKIRIERIKHIMQ